MTFKSLLFPDEGTDSREVSANKKMPAFFTDLNLDQVVRTITAGKEQYNLLPYFYREPVNLTTIFYRQQVFRDLEPEELSKKIGEFANEMQHIREELAGLEKIRDKYQKERFFLDVVESY